MTGTDWNGEDLLDPSAIDASDLPADIDCRASLMRSAVVDAAAIISGCSADRASVPAAPPPAAPATDSSLAPYRCTLMAVALALTAKEMNAKYKETSEGGVAVSLVLC